VKTLLKKLSIYKIARTESSVIAYLQYNKLNKKLIICFNSGSVYIYSRVPRVYATYLFGADTNGFSVGQVFNAIIKDNADIPFRMLGQAQMEFSLDNIREI
tara:strand:+ start:847 stop:1149 length:303 start_codon:yes stop_codon:yes gene_type:complete